MPEKKKVEITTKEKVKMPKTKKTAEPQVVVKRKILFVASY